MPGVFFDLHVAWYRVQVSELMKYSDADAYMDYDARSKASKQNCIGLHVTSQHLISPQHLLATERAQALNITLEAGAFGQIRRDNIQAKRNSKPHIRSYLHLTSPLPDSCFRVAVAGSDLDAGGGR